MFKRIRFFIPMVLMFSLLFCGTALAHGVISEELDGGKVRFSYDDGKPMANEHVHVLDAEGNEIAEGETDADGVFDFSSYENAAVIEAFDAAGHHAEHEVGTEGGHHDHDHDHDHDDEGSNTPVILGAVVAIALVGGFFYMRNKKKAQ